MKGEGIDLGGQEDMRGTEKKEDGQRGWGRRKDNEVGQGTDFYSPHEQI